MNDFYTLPLTPVKDGSGHDLKVTVKLPSGEVYIQVWKLDVGRWKPGRKRGGNVVPVRRG